MKKKAYRKITVNGKELIRTTDDCKKIKASDLNQHIPKDRYGNYIDRTTDD